MTVAYSICLALATASLAGQEATESSDCNHISGPAIEYVDLPGYPFMAVPTRDGCWVFVSLSGVNQVRAGAVAVLRRAAGKVSLARTAEVSSGLTGVTLTHDGKLLIAANGSGIVVFDVARLLSGSSEPVLGYLNSKADIPPDTLRYLGPQRAAQTKEAGSIQVISTNDDRFLLVVDEWSESITVVDLVKARASNYNPSSIIGRIPVGVLPVGVVFSADERYLYTTSEIAPSSYGWPVECKPEGADTSRMQPQNPQGAILVVDVLKMKSDPESAVVGKVPAGCSPVRIAISPQGDRLFVTARNSNAVLAFDRDKLLMDPTHALIGTVPVGTSPVGIAVVDAGAKIIVTNSNRFAADLSQNQSLSVIDAKKISSGQPALLGQLPAGAFPRELRVTFDERLLLVANAASKTLELVDLTRLPLQKSQPGK